MKEAVGNTFNEIFDSLGEVISKDTTKLVPKDSCGIDLADLIDDHVYGLLSEDSLTNQQITLLSALLQTRV